METVSRVGPCEAEVKLIGISDVREKKRKQIISRAAELLKEWDSKSLEPSEIEEKIDKDIKLGEITTWGPDNLPAGPEIESSPELIIVEGRADVLNLLRIGIKNSVAVQGTQVPKSIIELSNRKKTVTAFLDGDRGGTIILNELLQVAKLDYVARAPEGYEVEELTRKQLVKALQNKKEATNIVEGEDLSEDKRDLDENEKILNKLLKKLKTKDKTTIIETIRTIDTGKSIGFDKKLHKLFEMPVGDVFEKIREFQDTRFLIFDGILTKRLLSISLNMKIQFIACKNKEESLKIPDQMSIFFF